MEVKETTKGPRVTVSRSHPELVKRLFEEEVTEIRDGVVEIKAVSRDAGFRTKMAVKSYDANVDPVGACVGVKGSRIHGIVRELRNENIDVIPFTSNIELFIKRALSPAKIQDITLDEEKRVADVNLKKEEVSLAIGKDGLNIKLASMITEYTINVYREIDAQQEDDIYLDEFADEIEEWVIEAIKNIGLDTAKAVLNAPRQVLIEKADLEEDTVDHVIEVLKAEFEDEE
jgi:N utilization substance protein A